MAVDFGLQGQVAIVTGSTSGIGHAMADALAAQGCNIVMNGLGEMNAIERARAEMAETHGVEVLYHGADMTKPDQIADMVRAQAMLIEALGRLQASESVAVLKQRYATEDEDCRWVSLKAADYIGGADAEALLKGPGLADKDGAPRRLAEKVTGKK